MSTIADPSLRGYWPRPWTAEDGGPRRWGVPEGQPGLGMRPGERLEVAAVVNDPYVTDMLIRREPGELYALRHTIPRTRPLRTPVQGWVERLDPDTLQVTAATPRLPAGRWWPGGIAAHAGGDLHMVLGHWAHRLSPDLDVLASHRLPNERPHNSFVVLGGGELVTKDCDAPEGVVPSTVSVLDPVTLLPVCPPLTLPEPCVGRLSSDGEEIVVIGATVLYRLRLDRDAGRLVVDGWEPRFGPDPDRSFGWDPVITGEHVLWMDNGRNLADRTMLGSGDAAGPVRLWWARRDDASAVRSAVISGLPHGTESNPPGWDPVGRIVVAYDAGNAVLRAWRMEGDELTPLWRRDGFAHAGHLIVCPDTRELIVGDWTDDPRMRRPALRRVLRPAMQAMTPVVALRRASLSSGSDSLVVLDLDTGEERGRTAVPSPCQAYLFPAPGWKRDVYYLSFTTIARVVVTGG